LKRSTNTELLVKTFHQRTGPTPTHPACPQNAPQQARDSLIGGLTTQRPILGAVPSPPGSYDYCWHKRGIPGGTARPKGPLLPANSGSGFALHPKKIQKPRFDMIEGFEWAQESLNVSGSCLFKRVCAYRFNPAPQPPSPPAPQPPSPRSSLHSHTV
jgi:hypothetical protein